MEEVLRKRTKSHPPRRSLMLIMLAQRSVDFTVTAYAVRLRRAHGTKLMSYAAAN